VKFRSTYFYLGFLAVLLVFFYFYEIKGSKIRQERATQEKKVFALKRPDIKQIRFKRGASEILLNREKATWEITKPVRTASDENVVEQVLIHLEDLEVQRMVVDTAADLAPFGLDKPVVEVGVFDSLSGKWESVAFGNKNPTGTYAYATATTRPGVFLVYNSEKTFFDKKLLDLRDKKLLRFEKVDVRGLDLIRRDGTVSFTKTDDNVWLMTKPIKTKANKTAINDILNKIDDSKAKSFEAERSPDLKAFGLEPPFIKANLYLGPDRTLKSLLIGNKTGDAYYAKDASREPVMTVDTSLVAELSKSVFDLRNRKPLDFVTYRTKKVAFKFGDLDFTAERDSADDWWLTEPFRTEGDNSAINGVLYDLQDLKAESFPADHPKDKELARFGLKRPLGQVTIWPEDKDTSQVLFIGKEKKDLCYVKNDQEPSVFLVKSDFLSKLKNKSLSDFRKKDPLDFMTYNLNALRFAEGEKVTEMRKRNNQWKLIRPKSRDLDYSDASDVISDLDDIKIVKFVAEKVTDLDKYGLKNPTATITVRWGQKNREEILDIGSTVDDSLIYVKRRDRDNLWQINKKDFKKFKESLRRLVKLS